MVWNQKQRLLAVVVLGAAGCASTNPRMNRPELAKNPKLQDTYVDAPELTPPQILPSTHFAAGRMFEAQGQLGKAINQYRRAIAVGHNHPAAYHHLGLILSKLQQHDEAVAMLRKAVELRPSDAVLRNNLGFELMFQQQWADAAEHLSKAIALQPKFARAHINLGMTLSKVGRFDDALAHFRTVLPEQDAQYNLGLMHRVAKRYTDAAAAFHRALERDPKFQAARTQLADIAPHLESKTKTDTAPSAKVPALAAQPITTPKIIAVAPAPPQETAANIIPVSTMRPQVVAPMPTVVVERKIEEAEARETIETIATVPSEENIIEIVEAPCDDQDEITAMIETGTLPAAPIDMIQDNSDWLTNELYEEVEDQLDRTRLVVSNETDTDSDPCEDEEFIEDDLIDDAVAELNAAFFPVPTKVIVTPPSDDATLMPFGSLNDEVSRVDDEIRCLLEETLEAMAMNTDSQSEQPVFEPIATPRADKSIVSAVSTNINEPAMRIDNTVATPSVPANDNTVFALKAPSTTRSQVVTVDTPQRKMVTPKIARLPSEEENPARLGWLTRMRNFEQRRIAIRSELDCLESLNEELTSQRLAAATEPSQPQESVVIRVADKPMPKKSATPARRTKRTRKPRMTLAYEPTEAKPVLAAPPRTIERRRIPAIQTRKRSNAVPVAIARPTNNEADIVAAVQIGPAIPANQPGPTKTVGTTNDTPDAEATFNWGDQFGDLEDMTSITHNEIRCWDDVEQNEPQNHAMPGQRLKWRSKGKMTPVRYNGRRNPFYDK